MGVIEFGYLVATLLVGILATVGYGVMSLTPPDVIIARRCFWGAALLLAGIAIVWGITTPESIWVRLPVVCIVAGVAIGGLTEGLRWTKMRNKPAIEEPVAEARLTSTAPNIPGGFGMYMDQASHIEIEGGEFSGTAGGMSINRTDHLKMKDVKASTTPPSRPLAKVTPSGKLRPLSNAQLSQKAEELAASIRSYEADLQVRRIILANTLSAFPKEREAEAAKIMAEANSVFVTRFLAPAREIAAEIVWRIGHRISFTGPDVSEGAHAVATGNLVGEKPLISTVFFLQDLAVRLSKN